MTAAATLALTVAGCGTTTTHVSASSTGAATSSVPSDAELGSMKPPTSWVGPASSPPAAKGKKLFVVVCTTQAELVNQMAMGVQQAAKAIGWSVTVTNGNFNPATESSAITGAINAGYSGIVLFCVDPPTVSAALQQAKAKSVPVVDGADVADGGPLVSATAPADWVRDGNMVGQAIIADSNGHANVAVIHADDSRHQKVRTDALVAKLETCSGCDVLDQPALSNADSITTKLPSLIQSLNSRFGSKLDYIVLPSGDTWPVAAPAIAGLHRSDLKVAVFDGSTADIDACRKGQIFADAANDYVWMGWAAVDQMNRLFNHAPPSSLDVAPAFMVDSSNCGSVPAGQNAAALVTFDFAAQYEKLWAGK